MASVKNPKAVQVDDGQKKLSIFASPISTLSPLWQSRGANDPRSSSIHTKTNGRNQGDEDEGGGAGPGLALVSTSGPVNLSSNSQTYPDDQIGNLHYHQMTGLNGTKIFIYSTMPYCMILRCVNGQAIPQPMWRIGNASRMGRLVVRRLLLFDRKSTTVS